MNWLDPDEVLEWLDGHSPGYAKIEAPKHAAVEFVRAYAERGTCHSECEVRGCECDRRVARLIAQRLGGGYEG